jgi:hypothetical protein
MSGIAFHGLLDSEKGREPAWLPAPAF